MKQIRKGNDIAITWTLTGGSIADAIVTLHDKFGRSVEFAYTITGNVVTGTYYGKDQTITGVYRLLLQKNIDAVGMVTIDKVDAFELTGICDFGIITGSDEGSITTASVEFESQLSVTTSTDAVTDVLVDGTSVVTNNIAYIPAIPTSTSELTNDSGYITESDIPVTSVNSQTGAVVLDIPTALSELTADATHRVVTDTQITAWNAKSEFSGSYNDLTDKPTIPSLDGYATEQWVEDKSYITSTALTTALADYTTTDDLNSLLAAKSDKVSKETTEDINITLTPDTLCVCATPIVSGVLLSIALQAAADDGYAHEYRLRFSTGTTKGSVDITGFTFPADDDLTIEEGKTYEINVCDGLGVWQSWDN